MKLRVEGEFEVLRVIPAIQVREDNIEEVKLFLEKYSQWEDREICQILPNSITIKCWGNHDGYQYINPKFDEFLVYDDEDNMYSMTKEEMLQEFIC